MTNVDVSDTAPETDASPTFDAASHAESMVGYHYRVDDYYEVGREKVREYARAVQDFHPTHWDEDRARNEYGYDNLLAPLTFISLVGILAQRRLFESAVTGYDPSQIMQTDQVLVFHKPIEVGDRLVCDVYLDSFRRAPKGADIIVTKNIVSNQRKELIQTTYTTLVGRSGEEIDPNIAQAVDEVIMYGMGATPPPERLQPITLNGDVGEIVQAPPRAPSANVVKFDSLSVGDELPGKVFRLTRGDLVNYAGVSGDANPIHWSDGVTEKVGLDNVVAHGMLTMGLGAGYVSGWLGDPGAVKEYNVRFTSPVYVDAHAAAEIEFTAKVKSLDPETRTGVIAITAVSGGKRIFGRAIATVQLG